MRAQSGKYVVPLESPSRWFLVYWLAGGKLGSAQRSISGPVNATGTGAILGKSVASRRPAVAHCTRRVEAQLRVCLLACWLARSLALWRVVYMLERAAGGPVWILTDRRKRRSANGPCGSAGCADRTKLRAAKGS